MDKINTILERVIVFCKHLGISHRSFSLSIGASSGYLHRLQNAKSNIGGRYLQKIIQSYPQLNSDWLMNGSGEMIHKAYRVEESGAFYGEKDHFKEALLQYLDDEDIKDKILETINKKDSDIIEEEK